MAENKTGGILLASRPPIRHAAPMSGLVAIVGRPNVGKSALFNRIVRKRIAIVHDQPGVTRDRVMAEAEWQGRPFSVVDTGGIGLRSGEKSTDIILQAAMEQVDLALEAATVILFVVNVQEGIVPLDIEVAAKLRATRKPVLVVVNKCDQERASLGASEFAALGFDRMFPVSAIHGRGSDALIEAAVEFLPPLSEAELASIPSETQETSATDGQPADPKPKPEPPIRIAIVGRPNVGKSSLINALTGSARVVVSPIPGTTRDAVDVPFEIDTDGIRQRYVLVDTAGVRKARKIEDSLEYFSVSRTKEAIANSDIAVLVLDAEAGILEQDKKIADIIIEERRACILIVNKWDLVQDAVRQAREKEVRIREARNRDRDDRKKPMTTLSEFGEWVQEKLFFLDYAPVIFTSAKEGFQLDRFLETVRFVAGQLRQKIPTSILNRTINQAIEQRQPISASGRRLNFYYATQVRLAPPTFLLFVNRDDDFDQPYRRYLSAELRKAFGYEGCPLVLVPKPRPKTIEPIHRGGTSRSGAKSASASSQEPQPELSAKAPVPRRDRPASPARRGGLGGPGPTPRATAPRRPGSAQVYGKAAAPGAPVRPNSPLAPGSRPAKPRRKPGARRPLTSGKRRAAQEQYRASRRSSNKGGPIRRPRRPQSNR